MLIRISLIIAIVAGLAAAGLGFVSVREKIITTMNERDAEKSEKEIAQKDLASTKKTLKTTQEDLTTTSNTLATTRTELQSMTSRADDLEKDKASLTTQLSDTRNERDDAQQQLVIWKAFKMTPEQMRTTIADLKTTTQENEALTAENKIFARDNKQLQAKLTSLIGPDQPVPLPPGLKGNVVAVDPKYDFVVLDIGGNQGVLERGEMLVNRDGRLVAKVRIASVSPERSVANILPEWRQAEVREGDQVLY